MCYCDIDIEKLAQVLRGLILDVIVGEVPFEQHFISAERLRRDIIPLVSAMMFAVGYGDYTDNKRYNSMHGAFQFLAEFLDGIDGQSPELRAPPFEAAQKFAEQMVKEAQLHATRAHAAKDTST